MSDTFVVNITAPGERLHTFEARLLRVPGLDGYFGVMAQRQPLVASLGLGLLRIQNSSGDDTWLAITGGFFEMMNNQVTILADRLIKPQDIPDTLVRSVKQIFFPVGVSLSPLAQTDLARALLAKKLRRTRASPNPGPSSPVAVASTPSSTPESPPGSG